MNLVKTLLATTLALSAASTFAATAEHAQVQDQNVVVSTQEAVEAQDESAAAAQPTAAQPQSEAAAEDSQVIAPELESNQ